MTTLCNGREDGGLPADDRGASLGDGLFETVLVRDGSPVWLEEHLTRLHAGCRSLALDFPDAVLRDEIRRLLRQAPAGPAVLRINLTRCGGRRGYAITNADSNRVLSLDPLPAPRRDFWERGVKAFICRTRLPVQRELAGIKHTNRLSQIMARSERPAGEFPEGLMLTPEGAVIEGIASNVFLVIGDELVTPALTEAGVEGVVRERILDHARQQGLPCVVRPRLDLDDVYRATELFFCNSLIGLWPVRALDCRHYRVGPVTRQLQAVFSAVWHG